MIAARNLLHIWEAGLAANALRRTLLLHAAASPARDDLLDVPVGERDADLFALRRELFGATMPVRLACPNCAEELEFDFDTRAVDPAPGPREPITVTAGEWSVTFRLPTSGDLLAADGTGTMQAARLAVLGRCVLRAHRRDEPVEVAELPAEVTDRMAAAATAADPCADVRLTVNCPACGTSTRAELDISSCLWSEVDAWAQSVLMDVHLLASSYGWTESTVLDLSPFRRRYYLELAGHA